MSRRRGSALAGFAVLTVLAAGCASTPPARRPAPSEIESAPRKPVAADVNLRGFPPAFRDGYAAGCGSRRADTRRRDEVRYKSDVNYMMGWDDGYSICARR